MPSTRLCLASVAALAISTSIASAQEAGLPGNASSLRESHGDWQVTCAVPEGVVHCAMSQTQVNGESRQRVVSIELANGGDTIAVNGALVLPFGLDLASGVALRLDEASTGAAQPFRTCLPVGCVVDVAFEANTVASIRAGSRLDVIATTDRGQEMIFTISLSGFSSAHDRVSELLR
ncbi:invasion associated locus B family protein [Devosia sp. XK-2]|uniref:invasion associated locus B family protein n=1 Tax=Devosia sp. XK-2 TaxID=3126689 RepID=UPI0030D4C860